MKKIVQVGLRVIWWLLRAGVVFWFLGTLCAPIYGWLNPWPEATKALRANGLRGVALMIGGSEERSQINETVRTERQRSYVVAPDSLKTMTIYAYQETTGTGIVGVQSELITSRTFLLWFVFWALSGAYSIYLLMACLKSRRGRGTPSSAKPEMIGSGGK